MTEIGIVLSNPYEPARRKVGSVGLPLDGVELRLDENGELSVRAPTVMPGYHGRPCPELEDGWFRTGDVAERDADGYVRLLGRTSTDILKSGGYKISALEIEEALRAHPAVVDVAVVGVPDEAWGDRVVAAVVARGPVTPDELRSFARARMAAYKVPREVVLVDELPRNPMGKVLKPELVRRLS
jgi:malonyl-CoA/methylmalonyl-CoA synthetase